MCCACPLNVHRSVTLWYTLISSDRSRSNIRSVNYTDRCNYEMMLRKLPARVLNQLCLDSTWLPLTAISDCIFLICYEKSQAPPIKIKMSMAFFLAHLFGVGVCCCGPLEILCVCMWINKNGLVEFWPQQHHICQSSTGLRELHNNSEKTNFSTRIGQKEERDRESKMHFVTRRKLFKITRFVVAGVVGIVAFLVIVYNFTFQSYEVIGESIQCETNSPLKLNYSCKLDIIDNSTQYWSFESRIPDGFSMPHMMVRINMNIVESN